MLSVERSIQPFIQNLFRIIKTDELPYLIIVLTDPFPVFRVQVHSIEIGQSSSVFIENLFFCRIALNDRNQAIDGVVQQRIRFRAAFFRQ